VTPSSKNPDDIRPNASDVRPVVASKRKGAPIWVFATATGLSGIALFIVLNNQRLTATAPSAEVRLADQVAMPASMPPLFIPAIPEPPPLPPADLIPVSPGPAGLTIQPTFIQAVPPPTVTPSPPHPALPNYPSPGFAQSPAASAAPASLAGNSSAVLIFDASAPPSRTAVGGGRLAEGAADSQMPTALSRLRRPSLTVPQGTLIPAVLETALDSTRPGNVRAIVSLDVTGFDGSQVVIPRGSRLFGEYQSDMAPGQRRVLVQWTRLVRPDGVSINLASPAADMQGRAGVEGRVDNHFLERFGASFLQSIMNIGAAVAGRSIGGDAPIILNATGGSPVAGSAPAAGLGQPTLRVEAGARVAVMASRDLEFSSGQSRQ